MREIKLPENENAKDFVYTRKVAYYETDQMGIIHHSNYIRWFEEARLAWLDAKGFSYHELEARKIVIPVTDVSCSYKRPIRYGDTVDVHVKLSSFHGIRFSAAYRVLDHKTGELMAEGQSGHCFLNDKMQPFRIKKEAPDVYEFFKSCLEESVDAF